MFRAALWLLMLTGVICVGFGCVAGYIAAAGSSDNGAAVIGAALAALLAILAFSLVAFPSRPPR